jgi:hypothetical protein
MRMTLKLRNIPYAANSENLSVRDEGPEVIRDANGVGKPHWVGGHELIVSITGPIPQTCHI